MASLRTGVESLKCLGLVDGVNRLGPKHGPIMLLPTRDELDVADNLLIAHESHFPELKGQIFMANIMFQMSHTRITSDVCKMVSVETLYPCTWDGLT